MMTYKRLIAAIFVLVALVAWGAATPNVTVAQDQLQIRDQDRAHADTRRLSAGSPSRIS